MKISDAALAHLGGAADEPDLTGTRYELAERIGQGGMGSVYRVRDTTLGRDVALKVLDTEGGAGRVRREAHVLAQLEHPGIVPVHDAGVLPDGRVFYVMKLVRGERLDAATQGATVEERLRLFRQVADAVGFAHSRGVVHRDIKPSNVMLGAFGEVLVLDWGIARVEGSGETTAGTPAPRPGTAAGTVLGTPGYMAPEQARGSDVDARADVYGLGALLHYLLSGSPPPGRVDLPGVPRPLHSIVERCLAAEPGARYASVPLLVADLDAFAERRRVAAHRESLLEGVARVLDRHRTAVLLVLAYVVMRMALIFFRRG
jgi:eukaryotic-like serine/threonine-protein kinase